MAHLGQLAHLEGDGEVAIRRGGALGVLRQTLLAHIRGEEEDGEVLPEAALLDLPAEHEAGLVRQLGAEDDQVRPAELELAQRIGGILGSGGLEARRVEHRRHAQGELVLALDDEDAALHRGARAYPNTAARRRGRDVAVRTAPYPGPAAGRTRAPAMDVMRMPPERTLTGGGGDA